MVECAMLSEDRCTCVGCGVMRRARRCVGDDEMRMRMSGRVVVQTSAMCGQ